MTAVTLSELLDAGVHFGHQWHPKEAHLNHDRNAATGLKIRVSNIKKLSKNGRY